ncbi:MAG: hypothetical protein HYS20_13885 [Rhodocyclales bacterium]|nr:hypothetical protein [Rhodocyclales bacterium]
MRFPLEIKLHSSIRQRALLVGFHSLTAVALAAAAWRVLPAVAIATMLLALTGSTFLADRAERKKSELTLLLDEQGLLTITPAGIEGAQMLAGCADLGWAVWLHWNAPAIGPDAAMRRGYMMLVPDNLPPTEWRGLRIWLRHRAGAQHSASADGGV